ncbi:hypothetical protein C8R47DRAFT_1221279 [Mycena vitilis]|nr:hypothetical protein C8R47DRAFT_1221279 [Mycena vitilis]
MDVTMSFDPYVSYDGNTTSLASSPESSRESSPASEISASSFDYDVAGEVARQCLLAARPSVHRWERVLFSTCTDVFLLAFLSALGPVPGPDIRQLFFSCHPSWDGVRPCQPMLTPPRDVFHAFLPSLTDIVLVGSPLPWGFTPYFQNIVTLDIRQLPPSMWPTVDALVTTLTASIGLEELTLEGGGVRDEQVVSAPRFEMPSLSVLTLMCEDNSDSIVPALRVLASGRYPLLRECHIEDFTREAWAAVTDIPALAFVDWVSVTGKGASPGQVTAFLHTVTSVVRLDLLSASDDFALNLFMFPIRLCPGLRFLSVRRVDVRRLISWVAIRQRHPALCLLKIEFHHELRLPISLQQYDLFSVLRMYVPDLITVPSLL